MVNFPVMLSLSRRDKDKHYFDKLRDPNKQKCFTFRRQAAFAGVTGRTNLSGGRVSR